MPITTNETCSQLIWTSEEFRKTVAVGVGQMDDYVTSGFGWLTSDLEQVLILVLDWHTITDSVMFIHP